MASTLQQLNELYADAKTCAKLVGLTYIDDDSRGITRRKQGKGFVYHDSDQQLIADKVLKERIAKLVIPPAWQEVWICPQTNGHILATGIDDKGRKQYIYHPKWRTMRDLIKFYRMIVFAKALPTIRKTIDGDISRQDLGRNIVLGVMLWLLDNTYIRIGNERYYEQNQSVGLTTLTTKNIVIAGPVITIAFKGKSGKDQQITFEDQRVANILNKLREQAGDRLFTYTDRTGQHILEAADMNQYLQEITGVAITAKDFRTWGGTLMAFHHLIETEKSSEETPKPEKVIVEAVDTAAAVLGNTRSVARSSYIHPHILNAYGTKHFTSYYQKAARKRTASGLDKRETELLGFLEQLFEAEFDLLKRT